MDTHVAQTDEPTPRWRRVALGVLALVLVCVLGKGYWVWTHPNLFGDQGITGELGPRPVGKAIMYAAVAFGPEDPKKDETITLHSISAHFLTNTAHAIATFAVCDDKQPRDSIASLAAPEVPQTFCQQLRPVTDGMKMRLRFDGPQDKAEYILMTLKATIPGTAHVNWITLNYTRSWEHFDQHGEDRSRQDWIIHATN